MAKQNQQRFVDFVCNILAILPREAGEAAEARLDTQGICCKQVLDRKKRRNGGIAQLGEHLLCKQGVRSSILLTSTISWMKSYKYIVNKKRKRNELEKKI